MIAKKKLFGLPISIILMAVVIVGAMMAGNSAVPSPAEAAGACGSRSEAPIPTVYQPYIRLACYDTGTWTDSGVQLHLTTKGALYCHSIMEWCGAFASFVVYNGLWEGDRSLDSVSREIKWHSPWKTDPIHIQYKYDDLRPWEKFLFRR